MAEEKDYYQLIGLARDATADEIRRAYREAVRKLHPDANPDDPQNTDLFLQVQKAYEILSDPTRRDAYDKTLPPEIASVQINSLYSRTHIPILAESQLVFVLTELSMPPESEKAPRPPINVSLVLDRSTSMKGARMDVVKNTAIELMRKMRPQDIFSIIAFSDRAEVIFPAGLRTNIREFETRIQMLQTGGGTEIFQGLKAGYNEVCRHKSPKYINHIILITDGRTYGDEANCISLAREANERGIGITGLGIGSEWNDAFLDSLATTTGGQTEYIAKTSDIKKFMEEKFNRLGKVFADGVRFQFTTDSFAKLNYAFRLQPETQPLEIDRSTLMMGNIHREEPLKVLFEFQVEGIPHDTQQINLGAGRLTMDIPAHQIVGYSKRLELVCSTSSKVIYEAPPPEIIKSLSKLTLYRLQEKAQQEVSEGKTEQAVKRLQNLATHLLSQGESKLAETVIDEVNNLKETLILSDDGRKAIKYGTRSLMIEPSKKETSP